MTDFPVAGPFLETMRRIFLPGIQLKQVMFQCREKTTKRFL
jgi:hypothetical protein